MSGPGSPFRRHAVRPAARGDERGFGMLVAVIILSLILAVVGLTIYNAAIDNVTTSAHGVQRDQALQAAESGIDMAYQKIASSSSLSTVPCSTTADPTPVTGTLGSAPSTSTYKVSFTYYTTLTSQTEISSCTARSSARAVKLVSVGTDLRQSATVQSEAHLSAPNTTREAFPDAIFTKGNLTLSGNTTINAATKTVYITGSLTCKGSNTSKAKQITVIGSVYIACPIPAVIRSTGTITVKVGKAITNTLYTTKNITITGNKTCTKIEGNLYAKGSITFTSTSCKNVFLSTLHSTTVRYAIHADDTSLVAPTKQTFPTVKWTTTGTTNGVAGWNLKPGWRAVSKTVIGCSTAYKYIGYAGNAYTTIGGVPTAKNLALFTSCKITFPTVAMRRSLAVFSTGGFTIKGNTKVSKATGVGPLTLFIVVPSYKNGTGPGTAFPSGATCGANIKESGTPTIASAINTLYYTPCSITITGTSGIQEGELYAGTTLTPVGTMTIGPPPKTFPGGTPGGTQSRSPLFGVIYIREYS